MQSWELASSYCCGVLFLLVALAAYRVTWFITKDVFPPMAWLRNRVVYKRAKVHPDTTVIIKRKWGEAVACPHCMGVYVSAAIVALADTVTSVPLPLLFAVAVAGAVSLAVNLGD